MKLPSLAALALLCASAFGAADPPSVSGIEFADSPSTLYVPAHAIAALCNLGLSRFGSTLQFNNVPMPDERELFDGTKLIALHDLTAAGAVIEWDSTTQSATVAINGNKVLVKLGSKRVEVNKKEQELRAYQGDVLILQTHVSTGRKGHRTPSGDFQAYGKERMHFSKLYDDAPMPWAVQVDGNVFIHGYPSVPRFPASHGCIRMPLYGKNPARYFWRWVSIGTPVTVSDSWSDSKPVQNNEKPVALPQAQSSTISRAYSK